MVKEVLRLMLEIMLTYNEAFNKSSTLQQLNLKFSKDDCVELIEVEVEP